MKLPEQHSADDLFVWLMHRFSEEFKERAILKGGMLLRLLGCPRHTLDLDYVFVPFRSKNDISSSILKIVNEIEDAEINSSINSKALRIIIKTNRVTIQVEANVDLECKSTEVTTSSFVSPSSNKDIVSTPKTIPS